MTTLSHEWEFGLRLDLLCFYLNISEHLPDISNIVIRGSFLFFWTIVLELKVIFVFLISPDSFTIFREIILRLLFLLLKCVECKCHDQILARLEVREDDWVLARNGRIENENSLWRAFPLIQDFAFWIINDARDRLFLAATVDIISAFNCGWSLVSNLLIECFYWVLLNDNVHHIFRYKVMHVLCPHSMDFVVRQVTIVFESLCLLNFGVIKDFLHDPSIFHFFSVPWLSASPSPVLGLVAFYWFATFTFSFFFRHACVQLWVSIREFPFLFDCVIVILRFAPATPSATWSLVCLLLFEWPPTRHCKRAQECANENNTWKSTPHISLMIC